MKNRLTSLDVFRGMTIMLMTIVNNPGDWGHIFTPLEHAQWNGYTPTDFVFPFFLFIVGITTVLSCKQRKINTETLLKTSTRTLRIFSLGLFLNFFYKIHFFGWEGYSLLIIRLLFTAIIVALLLTNYNKKLEFIIAVSVTLVLLLLAFFTTAFENVRIPGVLQRIAIVYFIISLLYYQFRVRNLLLTAITILLAYWGIMTFVPVPGFGTANLEPGTNLAAWFDGLFLKGHMWSQTKTWDPEGILSTIPAISTGIMGILAGRILLSNRSNKILYLLAFGSSCLLIGHLWHFFFPINKSLWTSSFVLTMAGYASIILTVLYFFIDKKKYTGWTKPFIIFGLNPMLVFFFSGIIPGVLGLITFKYNENIVNIQQYLFNYHIQPWFTNLKLASLAGALIYLTIWFIILYIFYRKKIIFKV
ncbi:acyltransferase family protein [Zhouia sp. PK063]|uniref:acyltransferase family protein n=1 Tax=Zhouia sp. PK063 TaxID=3373602 RepID=UPI003797AFBE